MKSMARMGKIARLAAVLLLFAAAAAAQVVVERSRDKVVISGTPYYIHIVKKGETAYSISRAYNVTVEELAKDNPAAASVLKEGQSLRIQVRPEPPKQETQAPVTPVVKDLSKYTYHKLKPGETIYSLSRSYGISEDVIVESNKSIDIYKLPVGSEIAIPKDYKAPSQQITTPVQAQQSVQVQPYMHKVEKGETFSSISDKYNISIRELRRANRDMRFPQVGGYLRIPGMEKTVSVPVEQPVSEEPVAEVIPEPVVEKAEGFTEIRGIRGTFNLAVLLPFYLRENSQRIETDLSDNSKAKKKVVFRSEDWIYPRSLDFIELYQGILLAADSLRSLGLDINIFAWDIKSDTTELTRLLNSGRLANMDLIIGPVYSHNLVKVAAYARNMGIPVVSPVPLYSNAALQGNPNLFLSNSTLSLEHAQKRIARKMADYYDSNFILIHSDTTGTDANHLRIKELIVNELSFRMPVENIKFREMLFYSRSKYGNDSINRLGSAFSDKSRNIVIIASEESPIISESMEAIHGLSRKFDISVFGYPAMRDVENLDPKYFFDLDVMLYYPYWIDYKKDNVKSFISDYRRLFLTEPAEKSYAWHGFDIGWYFVSGLAMHGKRFIENPAMHNPKLLENYFDFIRSGQENGFENQNMFLIRYSKDYEVGVINE